MGNKTTGREIKALIELCYNWKFEILYLCFLKLWKNSGYIQWWCDALLFQIPQNMDTIGITSYSGIALN